MPGEYIQANKIDLQRIQHIAKLSRLGISDQEAEQYAGQMNAVLGYLDILQEADTEGKEMTLQVTGLCNVLREDEVKTQVPSDDLLEVSTLLKINGQIAVRAVIKEE